MSEAALAAALAAGDIPRASALTARFSRGRPRSFTASSTGERVAFLRARSAAVPTQVLHACDLDCAMPVPQVWVDPDGLPAGGELPAAEAARRERQRESGAGIVAFSTDDAMTVAAFAVAGVVWVAHWPASGERGGGRPMAPLRMAESGVDPRVSPDGRFLAWVAEGSVWGAPIPQPGEPLPAARRLIGHQPELPDTHRQGAGGSAAPGEATVTYGLADFIAAEEFSRLRGLWWAPDSSALLAAGVDSAGVEIAWLADPAAPQARPREHRYPRAGTANARVWLVSADLVDGRLHRLDLPNHPAGDPSADPAPEDRPAEYLIDAGWIDPGRIVATTLTRDQRDLRTWCWDLDSPTLEPLCLHHEHTTPWVTVMPGLPHVLADGRVVHLWDDRLTNTRRLAVGGIPLTQPGQTVTAVSITGDSALVSLHDGPPSGATALGTRLLRISLRGDPADTPAVDLTPRGGPAVDVAAASGGGTLIVASIALGETQPVVAVHSRERSLTLGSVAVRPPAPRLTVLDIPGTRPAIVCWPSSPSPGPSPVICAPYGGPHARRVIATGGAYVLDQWLADAGFIVLIADGPGTPGTLSDEWAVNGDLLGPPVAGQVRALDALAAAYPDEVDGSRVGIHGWSFGGYLAAGAVLTRPDRFHAAVAGAPVADWRLYDTGYSERYLGHPEHHAAAYDGSSLITAATVAARAEILPGPLLLIHGLADDNVLAAHTLRLSAALLAGGLRHEVLPLPGVSHMTGGASIAETLERVTRDFFIRALG